MTKPLAGLFCVIRVLSALLLPLPAAAALAPRGAEVNLATDSSGSQGAPALAARGQEFVAVWRDGSRLVGRRLAPTGELVGDEVPIDAGTNEGSDVPEIAALADGYVVVWRKDDPGDEEPPRIVARLLDATGTPLGDEFRIDAERDLPLAGYHLSAPKVAVAGNLFVVVWASGTHNTMFDFYETDVFARTFHANGTPAFEAASLLGGGLADSALEPDIAAHSAGFTVAWRSGSTLWTDGVIRGRKLTEAGFPIGAELYFAPGRNDQPVVIGQDDETQVLWTARPYGSQDDVGLRGRRFDASGMPTLPEFAIHGGDATEDRLPGDEIAAAAPLGTLGVLVAWIAGEGASEDGNTGLWAQAVSPDGRTTTSLRQVNEEFGDVLSDVDVAVLDDSTVAVAWQRDDDVVARVFAVTGPHCGDSDGDGSTTSRDALAALRAAVGSAACTPCICDADGSGAHATSDALAVLRSAVGLAADLDCPACMEGAGTPFDLMPEAGCFGSHVEVPREALPDELDLVHCTLHPALVPRSCEASVDVGENGIVFDARGCELPKTVFSCVMPEETTAGIAQSAVVRCGCRCGPCADSPALCRSGDACAPSAAAPASVPASGAAAGGFLREDELDSAEHSTVTTTVTDMEPIGTTTSSSTSFCGTCCNLEELGQLEATGEAVVTELVVRVASQDTTDCTFCFRDYSSYTGEVFASGEDEFTTICFVDHAGFPASGVLAGCEGHGWFANGPAEVLHARGQNFEPVEPPPSVLVAPIPAP